LLSKLGEYEGKAQEKLTAKEVSGRKANGFRVGLREIDPDAPNGTAEVWVDAETRLPVLVLVSMKLQSIDIKLRLDNLVWNKPLDEKIFDTTAPVGSKDESPAPPTVKDQVAEIKKAFKKYAELSGGHYPRTKMIYGDQIMHEMREMAGFKGLPKVEWMTDEKYTSLRSYTMGLRHAWSILKNNADAIYSGKTVGPKDADKVLLRWQLEDGNYHVIFGDLKNKQLTPKELAEVEGGDD